MALSSQPPYTGLLRSFIHSLTSFSENDADNGTKKGNNDVKIFNISLLKNFEIIKECPSKLAKSLHALDLEKADRRFKAKVNEKLLAANRVGVDVTPEGQRLYDTLAKQ